MISLILPYWNRQRAASYALTMLAVQYEGLDLEVIVVDDGSPEPFVAPEQLPFAVKVIRLEVKDVPLNPCVPINRGVDAASGDYIALSNPEIIHDYPVLEQMRAEIDKGGPDTYVMAACWCPEQSRWHCHSSVRRSDGNDVGAWLPPGSDYHFMSMMTRFTWNKTGGFDEDYRNGAGYDDPDFVRRLDRAGARFVMRDDLVVRHPRTGARAEWSQEGFYRNRRLFLSKWSKYGAAESHRNAA